MAKNATLDSSLVDSLVASVVDPLRSALYPQMGIRAYNVALVRRRWAGGRRNQGTPSFVEEVTMDPPPKVTIENNQMALRYDAQPHGRDEEGEVILSEVSLQYTEGELTGEPIAINEEFYYRITDAHGQAMKPRYYVITGPPVPDREKDIGWRVRLRRVAVDESD